MKLDKFIIAAILAMFICLWFMIEICFAEINDTLAVRAIIGEGANQGFTGMWALASAIVNRGTLQGVYGLNAKHIDKEPTWVWEQAQRAWQEAKSGNLLHKGDHWENIKAFGEPYWVKDMVCVYEYKDHRFYRKD